MASGWRAGGLWYGMSAESALFVSPSFVGIALWCVEYRKAAASDVYTPLWRADDRALRDCRTIAQSDLAPKAKARIFRSKTKLHVHVPLALPFSTGDS